MARKKVEKTEETSSAELSINEKLKKIKKVTEEINASATEVVCGFIDDPIIKDRLTLKFIPTPNDDLNEAIGGGFPIGRTTIVTGLSDSGKTGLLLETVGQQMSRDDKFICLWLESEGSLNWDYMINTFGIDPSRFVLVQMSSKDGAEAALDRCYQYLKSGTINMFVINSLRALTPKTIFVKDISEDTMAAQARMNTKMLSKYLTTIYENDICFCIVQHLSTMINSMSRDPYSLGGGLFLKYGGMLVLDMRKQTVLDTDPIKRDEGMKIMISVKKNHVTPRLYPYVKVEHFVIYDEGTEIVFSTLKKAVEQGIMESSGSWIMWPEKDLKWQGKANFRTFMRENPQVFDELRKKVSGNVERLTEEEMQELHINVEEDAKEQEEIEKALAEESNE